MSQRDPDTRSRASVDLVIPVLNEAHVLEKSVTTVREYLGREFPHDWRVVIVDNGSTDGTALVAQRLSRTYPDVRFVYLSQRGRGRALRHAWTESDADVVCYTDVDLSTELAALPKLVSAIVEDGCDVAIGSRLLPQSRTTRSSKREFISRVYNLMIKLLFFPPFSDAQCGFKAVSRRTVEEIVPRIEDESWFFDTELLLLADRAGYRIADIPVTWIEDDDSRVKIVRTAWEDIKGLLRLRRAFWKEDAARLLRRPAAGTAAAAPASAAPAAHAAAAPRCEAPVPEPVGAESGTATHAASAVRQ